jgi:HAD superfamily hydrolase (TIGR01509 family)
MTPRPGVIFDVDGTLVDSNYVHVLAWSRAFVAGGCEVAMADIHRLIGKGSHELVEDLVGEVRTELIDAHGEHLRDLAGEIRAFPAAGDLLRAVADRGLSVALASSAKPEDHERNLEAIDADEAIAFSTQSGDVDAAKPAPDIFEYAMTEAGLDPAATVVVGDTVWDVRAASRSGLPTIGLTCGGIAEAELRAAGAREVFRDPSDLYERFAASMLSRLETAL